MNIWFTGDTHFGHDRTRALSKRPFKSVADMDNYVIEKWNNTVSEDDIVYHIGDFGNYDISHKLKGKIILLLGNYERKDISERIINVNELKNDFNFYKVLESKHHYIEELNIDIVHEPSHRAVDRFTLFGHIHKLQMVKKNALNVGVDCHNFAPVSVEDVLFYKTAIENYYDDEVFMF